MDEGNGALLLRIQSRFNKMIARSDSIIPSVDWQQNRISYHCFIDLSESVVRLDRLRKVIGPSRKALFLFLMRSNREEQPLDKKQLSWLKVASPTSHAFTFLKCEARKAAKPPQVST